MGCDVCVGWNPSCVHELPPSHTFPEPRSSRIPLELVSFHVVFVKILSVQVFRHEYSCLCVSGVNWDGFWSLFSCKLRV